MSRIRLGLALVSLAVGVAAAGSFALGWRLTRRRAPVVRETPPVLGGTTAEALRLTSKDGLRFGAWLYPRPEAECAAVLVHGNGSSRSGLRTLTEEVLAAGCHALPITVRAHGDAEGEVNDFGYGARHEVIAAIALLEARFPEARRAVIGVSLGSAAALFAGAELGDRAQAYLLESPYASLEQATKNRIGMFLPAPLVPLAYATLTGWAGVLLDTPVDAIAPAHAATRLDPEARVIVLAGTADVRATVAEARQVADGIPGEAELVIFEGAAHDELWGRAPERYRAALRRALGRPSLGR